MVGHWCYMFNEGRLDVEHEDGNGRPPVSKNENNVTRIQGMVFLNNLETYKFTSDEEILAKSMLRQSSKSNESYLDTKTALALFEFGATQVIALPRPTMDCRTRSYKSKVLAMWSQKKESRGLRSRERGSQAIGPPHQILVPGSMPTYALFNYSAIATK
ncbi:hypothetical protein TNCV_261841 [Trichonephila clavipes]|nr:hypothetical protein TNCV_261841 [Trichonephila clavipes]